MQLPDSGDPDGSSQGLHIRIQGASELQSGMPDSHGTTPAALLATDPSRSHSRFKQAAGPTLQGPLRLGPREMLSISPPCVSACTRSTVLWCPLPEASKAAAVTRDPFQPSQANSESPLESWEAGLDSWEVDVSVAALWSLAGPDRLESSSLLTPCMRF